MNRHTVLVSAAWSLAGCSPSAAPTPTRRVVDAPTRMFHWRFALCFVGAYLSADGERWRMLHVTLGHTLAGLLCFRVLYGLFGPKHARLSLLRRKNQAQPMLTGRVPGAGPDLAKKNHAWLAALFFHLEQEAFSLK